MTTSTIPAIGSFVRIRFGAAATQIGYVDGHTTTGRAKVRAWNASRNRWMPNTRTLDLDAILERGEHLGRGLPHPSKA